MNNLFSRCCHASIIIISSKKDQNLNTKKICSKCGKVFDKKYHKVLHSYFNLGLPMHELAEKFQDYLNDMHETGQLPVDEILTDNEQCLQLFLEFVEDYHLEFEKFAFDELNNFKDFLLKNEQ